ncbi:flagellar basal-body MS-ring/collar protein FliF [Marinospirillum alkaliphilum]|uniref:Flagellar M-ring protein n=1 Tax=Marinospirillum alkaliphilum DSM 21637 TaxID=1122209 RepID=A0A1K1VBJ4_9GAMM|nr:flagellar basal-body MS-ring/collar protein FliF [Marinospirillum alkaliphilum]SFX22132.1 flagellar M-ring protein FliF [Marinospirillum alkaliphilum DSM 21637]
MENAPANVAADSAANLPEAVQADAGGVTADKGDRQGKSSFLKSGSRAETILSNFNQLDVLRQMALLIGFAASIALGFAVVLWSQSDSYRPLMSSLNEVDSAAIVEILEQNRIKYRIDPSSGALLVREDDIHRARMQVAGADIRQPNTVGYELLERDQGLGTSQFMENARYLRSVEGELSRTISSLESVRQARVHLAVPRQSVFLRDQRKPSASVFLNLTPGRSMEPSQAQAIMRLVASSIPQMDAKDVTIVDQRGNLLSQREENETDKAMARQLEHTRLVEQRINERIRSILEPVAGPGRFQAAVSVDIDFTQIEQSAELFNPDMPAIRSEQTVDEQRSGDFGPMGIPGALSNQPPQDGFAPEEAAGLGGGAQTPTNRRSQATRNFELDRTLSYSRNDSGRIARMTVAVVVDDLIQRNPQTGVAERLPWNENEIERITTLVRNAVGYSAARGDSVSVINSPFVEGMVEELPALPLWEQPWVWDLAKQILAGLFVLILIFGVLRPILRNLATRSDKDVDDAELDALAPLDGGLSDDQVTLSASDDPLLAPPSDLYERQLNAIRALIAENPGRVAQVVRHWIANNE